MPQTYLLDGAEWRAFRLFLINLEDRELDRIHRQLLREAAAYQERARHHATVFQLPPGGRPGGPSKDHSRGAARSSTGSADFGSGG